ncbi:LysM peptidoglycan-binding domain-containing protein [Photobacterium piscicola]|uniref:LysM peptidoglycan-binding domain-containing protein n=1 Tax=Photobacterium piscicola TaxID=1378299 RepID=UPI003735FA0F
MSNTYTVKQGDTLIGIAIDHNISFVVLLQLNPQYQNNPDLILVGQTVTLPTVKESDGSQQDEMVEVLPVQKRPDSKTGEVMGRPQCQGIEVHEVAFQTGDSPEHYYVMDKFAKDLLDKEIIETEKLINNYKILLDNAPKNNESDDEVIKQHRQRALKWYEIAVQAGAISGSNTDELSLEVDAKQQNATYLKSKLEETKLRKQFVDSYKPWFNVSERLLKEITQKALHEQIKDLEQKIANLDKEIKEESSVKQSVTQDNFSQKNRNLSPSTSTTLRVIEIYVVSHGQLVYVRSAFLERETTFWRQGQSSNALRTALSTGNWGAVGQAIVDDIKKGMGDSANNSLAGPIEIKLKEWKADGYKAQEWKATQDWVNGAGETIYAVSSEAQLLRFAAQASIKGDLNLKDAKFDLGFAAEASASLLEGSVKFTHFYPYERGYSLCIDYIDANKKPMNYPLGRVRLHSELILSCLVGGWVQGKAVLTNKAQDISGVGIVLNPHRNLGISQSGAVGVSAEGFAGGQVGGQLLGSMQWETPSNTGKTDFKSLAELKAEGNVALGVGIGGDFQIRLIGGKFELHCAGRLVFGPGASGGFGTVLDLDALFDLATVIWRGTDAIGYRILNCLDKATYKYFYHAAYAAFVNNTFMNLKHALNQGDQVINDWWDIRIERYKNIEYQCNEAKVLAKNILNKNIYSKVSIGILPPEVVGIMLNTLVTTYWFNWNDEPQEKAIYIILAGHVKSWRKFIEVLAHMNEEGEKDNTDDAIFNNLRRINAILSGDQQDEFDSWIHMLANIDRVESIFNKTNKSLEPFTFYSVGLKYKKKKEVESNIKQITNNFTNPL